MYKFSRLCQVIQRNRLTLLLADQNICDYSSFLWTTIFSNLTEFRISFNVSSLFFRSFSLCFSSFLVLFFLLHFFLFIFLFYFFSSNSLCVFLVSTFFFITWILFLCSVNTWNIKCVIMSSCVMHLDLLWYCFVSYQSYRCNEKYNERYSTTA